MTQKELLYLEDAIGHERNIIAICEENKNFLDSDELLSFMDNEIKVHTSMLDSLFKILKGCAE